MYRAARMYPDRVDTGICLTTLGMVVVQANSDLKTELDAAKAARRLAEWESSEVNKMNTARSVEVD